MGNNCSVDAQCGPELLCYLGGCLRFDSTLNRDCVSDMDCGNYRAACIQDRCLALASEGAYCSPWGTSAVQPHCKWFEGEGCLAGTCQALPRVGKGQACGYDVALCEGKLSCVSNVCIEIVPEGGACTSDDVCGPYASCHDGACTFSELVDACTPTSGG
jgi:hypothetical protein